MSFIETPRQASHRKRLFWLRRRQCNRIGFLIGLLVLTPFFVLLFDRREPIELIDGRFDPDIVVAGQSVNVVWRAIEHKKCEGELERRITDAANKITVYAREPTIYYLAEPIPGAPLDSPRTFVKPFTISAGISEGEATYQTTGFRWCNIVQKYLWPIPFKGPPIKFEVIERVSGSIPLPPPRRGRAKE